MPCCTGASHGGTPTCQMPRSGSGGKSGTRKWSGSPPSPHCRPVLLPPVDITPPCASAPPVDFMPPFPVTPPEPATPPLSRLASDPPSGSELDEPSQPKRTAPTTRPAASIRIGHRRIAETLVPAGPSSFAGSSLIRPRAPFVRQRLLCPPEHCLVFLHETTLTISEPNSHFASSSCMI
jgi:hypothetical protein